MAKFAKLSYVEMLGAILKVAEQRLGIHTINVERDYEHIGKAVSGNVKIVTP